MAAGIDTVRTRLYEKFRAQGMSHGEALMKADKQSRIRKDLKGENLGTKAAIGRIRRGGLTDAEIEETGVFKFRKPKPKRKRRRSLARAIVGKALTKGRELRYGKGTYLHETPEQRKARVKRQRG